MNRCRPRVAPFVRSALLGAAVAGLGVALLTTAARAQVANEAAAGGRNFPANALRGSFLVVNSPEIELDGRAERMAPGVRIYSAQNMLVMPASITGQKLLVNYTRDAAGLVGQVWVLTPTEAQVKRASAERPLLNFWPFASSAPHDDGQTPFDQLPVYQGNQH